MKREFTKLMAALALLLCFVMPATGWGQTKSNVTVTSEAVVTNSGYAAYNTTVDGRDYVITFGGNNKSVGTNSSSRNNCKLTNYSKYAVSPVTTSSTASAFACKTSLSNINKVTFSVGGGKNQNNTKVYLIYSANNNTFSQVALTEGVQGGTINSNTFEFSTVSGYFALLFQATNTTGDWRLDNVSITFYEAEGPSYEISLMQPVAGGSIGSSHSSATQGKEITLTKSVDVGYTFGEWVVKDVNNNPITVTNDKFIMPASNVTVSAVFNLATLRTVSFDINGTVEMTAKVNDGQSIDLSKFMAIVNTSGYVFKGWSDTPNGTALADNYTPQGDVILYALIEQSIGYDLVTDLNTISAGTYLFGALAQSGTNPELKYRFATSTVSGDWTVTDFVNCADGTVPSLPQGACEIVLTGNNTNGFTVSVEGSYLGYTQSANRKLATGNDYSSYLWKFSNKSPNMNTYNVVMHRGTSYYVYDNSTSETALRGYASEQANARGFYLFKKKE